MGYYILWASEMAVRWGLWFLAFTLNKSTDLIEGFPDTMVSFYGK